MQSQGKKQDNKKKKHIPNPLETLKDVTKDTGQAMRNEVAQIGSDMVEELLGINLAAKTSGEILPGQTIELAKTVFEKKSEKSADNQIFFERQILEQERAQIENKKNELRIQLKLIQEEMVVLASKTEGLSEEIQIATLQATVEPGQYHIIFFEKLMGFINSFRKKIESASEWLHIANTRSKKKNVWGANYKKQGAKYLLSSEHYLSRSAG